MILGVETLVVGDSAEISFLTRDAHKANLGKLLAAARAVGERVRPDTGGVRKTYRVPLSVAVSAGLADPSFLPLSPPESDLDALEGSTPSETVNEPENATQEALRSPESDEAGAGYVEVPPRPGFKGATKAAWQKHLDAHGIEYESTESVADLVARWDNRS